jgi:Cof subfamily protein (haloacid dehalogenase superfamily)
MLEKSPTIVYNEVILGKESSTIMNNLIFLDIDGTLLARGGVHPRTKAAIAQAMAQGDYVLINTGRAKGNIPTAMLGDVALSGIVAGLGCYIELDGKVLLSHAMSDVEIAYAMRVADQCELGLVLEGEDMLIDYHPERSNRWPACGKQFSTLEELRTRFPSLRVSKMGYMSPLPEQIAKEMQQTFTLINHPTYAEFGTKGYSKASAMTYLMEQLGIDRDHVYAMGDSLNDVEMLQAAGTAVVMGDGHPEVKKLADFISVAAHEGGVGHAIEELILKK